MLRDDLHMNGVHLLCQMPGKKWTGQKYIGDGTYRSCPLAGMVERIHGHDFDGQLICGCDGARTN